MSRGAEPRSKLAELGPDRCTRQLSALRMLRPIGGFMFEANRQSPEARPFPPTRGDLKVPPHALAAKWPPDDDDLPGAPGGGLPGGLPGGGAPGGGGFPGGYPGGGAPGGFDAGDGDFKSGKGKLVA